MKRIKNSKPNLAVHTVTPEEKATVMAELDKQYPGYLCENQKMVTIVLILAGLRLLYGLFYLSVFYMYELDLTRGVLNFISTVFFLLWYSLMLRTGRGLAFAMLALRGYGIVSGSVSILSMSYYHLPFTLIFTLVFAIVMEFVEAVFCIYVMFNPLASLTVKLNRGLDQVLAQGVVSKTTLEHMAEYRNDCDDPEEEKSPEKEDAAECRDQTDENEK